MEIQGEKLSESNFKLLRRLISRSNCFLVLLPNFHNIKRCYPFIVAQNCIFVNSMDTLVFVRSGWANIDGGAMSLVGQGGYYWSRTSKSATNAYGLAFYPSLVNPSNYNERRDGYPPSAASTQVVPNGGKKKENTTFGTRSRRPVVTGGLLTSFGSRCATQSVFYGCRLGRSRVNSTSPLVSYAVRRRFPKVVLSSHSLIFITMSSTAAEGVTSKTPKTSCWRIGVCRTDIVVAKS